LMLFCGACSLPFAVIPLVTHIAAVLALMFVAMFAAAGFIVLSVIDANRVYSSNHSGFLAGAGAGAWSAVVALTMPSFGRLFDTRDYRMAFLLAAVFPVAGLTGWLTLSRDTVPKPPLRCLH
jgi:MFS transporter, ACS family, hexuronate transporter